MESQNGVIGDEKIQQNLGQKPTTRKNRKNPSVSNHCLAANGLEGGAAPADPRVGPIGGRSTVILSTSVCICASLSFS